MVDPQKFTFEAVVSLRDRPELKEIDQRISEALGLNVVPAASASKWNLLAEVSQAGFPVEELSAVLVSKKDAIIEFGVRWNRLCEKLDHGEEFDPSEGEQQAAVRHKVIGLSEGAAVSY